MNGIESCYTQSERERKRKRWSIKKQNNQCQEREILSVEFYWVFIQSRHSSESECVCVCVLLWCALLCFITLNAWATLRVPIVFGCEWFPWAKHEFSFIKFEVWMTKIVLVCVVCAIEIWDENRFVVAAHSTAQHGSVWQQVTTTLLPPFAIAAASSWIFLGKLLIVIRMAV